MKILVTGAAGFIGYHTIKKLQEYSDIFIYGIDNINDYYDVQLKLDRLEDLRFSKNTTFEQVDLNNKYLLDKIFKEFKPDIVLHLAAQAGVRYSLENPTSYIQSNIDGFQVVIDLCKEYQIDHFIYASSSSVYGNNKKIPFSIQDPTESPASLYAATKKSNELVAYTYSHLYDLKTTGLRFFTVYGPWGRPDMAYYIFSDAVRNSKPITVYNHGNMSRDFTYVEDIANGILKIINTIPKEDYNIYNLGNNNPTSLSVLVSKIEEKFGVELQKIYKDMTPGDVLSTYADISETQRDFNFNPKTSLDEGLDRFIEWYKDYYRM